MKIAGVIGLTLAVALGAAEAQEKETAVSPAIENGAKVRLEYTLKDDGGKVLDSNKGRDPLTYTQGQKQIIPGLEQALNGMRAGDEKTVTVKPVDAYGEVNPNAVTEVPKEMLPPDALKVGTELVAQSQGGDRQIVRIKEVREKTVVIDLNHPLAGKTLFFDVKVLGVESPKK
ncbi:MAG: peptidylprolyl isomerase [Candidatus Rokubacteria bacterium]|nr:peptidylprolyl isomerase [Candidatus Rokubacteria bacterium]